MNFQNRPFAKALVVSAAVHGMTFGSLEALSGQWSRTVEDWIPSAETIEAARNGSLADDDDDSNTLLWLPESPKDEIETVTVTPNPRPKTADRAHESDAEETARTASTGMPGATTATDDAVASLKRKLQAELHRVISEEWKRELRENSDATREASQRVLLKLEWSAGLERVESVDWLPSGRLPGTLQQRIEARLRSGVLEESFQQELTVDEREALSSVPRQLMLPVKFVRVR